MSIITLFPFVLFSLGAVFLGICKVFDDVSYFAKLIGIDLRNTFAGFVFKPAYDGLKRFAKLFVIRLILHALTPPSEHSALRRARSRQEQCQC